MAALRCTFGRWRVYRPRMHERNRTELATRLMDQFRKLGLKYDRIEIGYKKFYAKNK